jgi:branched-subunit amino acid ABC-type transport system permease component
MKAYLPFIVIGVFTGSLYALAAAGLVLTYKTSGIFNFAHGAVGMFSAYVFFHFHVSWGWPTLPSILIAVLGFAPLMGILLDRGLLRWLEGAGTVAYIVATLGLLVLLQGLAVVWKTGERFTIEPYFPLDRHKLGDVFVTTEQLLVVAIVLAVGLALVAFFRFTSLGLKTRAVVTNRELTGLVGTNSGAVTTGSWILGCVIAALSAILFVPTLGLDPVNLTLLVLTAVAAATAGRLTNLPVTMVAGFALGVAQSLTTKAVAPHLGLLGIPSSLPFIVLFLIMVFSPKRAFKGATSGEEKTGTGVVGPEKVRLASIAVVTAGAAFLPLVLKEFQLVTATHTIGMVLVFASLSLLVGLGREISLCHAIFAGFAATTLSHFLSAGVPYLPALLLAALVMVPVAALVAIPSLRLSGLFLALATFGFGKMVQDILFPTSLAFGRSGVAAIPRPSLFNGPVAFYYLVLAITVIGVLVVEVVRVGRLGRILRAVADSPTAIQSLGVNPTASRVFVFCLSAFLAGLGGGLIGSLFQNINPSSFEFSQSLLWVTVLVAAGARTFGGSVLAAVLLIATPAFVRNETITLWQPVAFGMTAMVMAQLPNGLVGLLSRQPDWSRLAGAARWRQDRRRATERYVNVALAQAAAAER